MLKRQNFSLVSLAGVLALSFHLQADDKYFTENLTQKVFMQPIEGLNDKELDKFILGRSFFTVPWVEAPSATTARDGLGPLFSANACISCHPNNGISPLYTNSNQISRGYVTKLSISSKDLKGYKPDPNYGYQISINGVHGVPFEAKQILQYESKLFTYPDGEKVILQKPLDKVENKLTNLNYGELHPKTILSNRLAPALVGLGLIEMLEDSQILANEDLEDRNNDGISGKANQVFCKVTKSIKVGRFTKKAAMATIYEQSAHAALNDMGLTNPLYPQENCAKNQIKCQNAPKGNFEFDLPERRLESIAFYLTHLQTPTSKITQKEGEKLFEQIGCTKCHTPSFELKNGLTIAPFSDFLLHDMGEDLADGMREYKAQPNEWKTAPLWGIGKYSLSLGKEANLLHDGRAKTIEEAILWHGGEAKEIRQNFINLPKEQREKILNYIKEL